MPVVCDSAIATERLIRFTSPAARQFLKALSVGRRPVFGTLGELQSFYLIVQTASPKIPSASTLDSAARMKASLAAYGK